MKYDTCVGIFNGRSATRIAMLHPSSRHFSPDEWKYRAYSAKAETFLVRWTWVTRSSHRYRRKVLYANVHADTGKIRYIGKAYRCTMGTRQQGPHKEKLRERLLSVDGGSHRLIMGAIIGHNVGRFTDEMLTDIESLLIIRERPLGNKRGKKTRTVYRPNMVVYCIGSWPGRQQRYIDTRACVRPS